MNGSSGENKSCEKKTLFLVHLESCVGLISGRKSKWDLPIYKNNFCFAFEQIKMNVNRRMTPVQLMKCV